MEILFWVSAFFVLYPYAGYPLLLWLLGLARKKPPAPDAGRETSVWVVIRVRAARSRCRRGLGRS